MMSTKPKYTIDFKPNINGNKYLDNPGDYNPETGYGTEPVNYIIDLGEGRYWITDHEAKVFNKLLFYYRKYGHGVNIDLITGIKTYSLCPTGSNGKYYVEFGLYDEEKQQVFNLTNEVSTLKACNKQKFLEK